MTAPQFFSISGQVIAKMLTQSHHTVRGIVRDAYLAHASGETINPDSYFLRFPSNPQARIIALPAAMTNYPSISGLKWISSYPGNVRQNLQRASAVIVLNDYDTGYPVAILEGSRISAARTAASAVLAAETLAQGTFAKKVGFVGAGVIARTVLEYMAALSWNIEEISIFDLNSESSDYFLRHVRQLGIKAHARVESTMEEAAQYANFLVFATTAATPYVSVDAIAPGQIVLNLSLRDLAPELILRSWNVVDDVEHCLKANTSLHLAEQLVSHREFVHCTLPQMLREPRSFTPDRPIVFSPFGLGVLDLAIARHIFVDARNQKDALHLQDFFWEAERWKT